MHAIALHRLLEAIHYTVGSLHLFLTSEPRVQSVALKELKGQLGRLGNVCEAPLELPMSGIAVKRTIEEIELSEKHAALDVPDAFRGVPQWVNGLIRTICEEVSLRVFMYLPEQQRALYTAQKPFGDAVWQRFPTTIEDIEEASKCLALQRGTAAVFHCMRVVDLGIRTVISEFAGGAEFLEQKDRRVWSALIRRVRNEAQKPDSAIAPRWVGKQGRLNEIAEKLNAVADASRNPTMHADISYSIDQANDVFQTTGAFMRRLAEELAEASADEAA